MLFAIATFADDSAECQAVIQQLLTHSDWSWTDPEFGNSPLLNAIACANHALIDPLFDYITSSRQNLAILTKRNDDKSDGILGSNTPLLLAIKNGDIPTAIRLIPYYSQIDLLETTQQGNNALHLACYFRMHEVIMTILQHSQDTKTLLTCNNLQGALPKTLYLFSYYESQPDFHNHRYLTLVLEPKKDSYAEQLKKVKTRSDIYFKSHASLCRNPEEEITKHQVNEFLQFSFVAKQPDILRQLKGQKVDQHANQVQKFSFFGNRDPHESELSNFKRPLLNALYNYRWQPMRVIDLTISQRIRFGLTKKSDEETFLIECNPLRQLYEHCQSDEINIHSCIKHIITFLENTNLPKYLQDDLHRIVHRLATVMNMQPIRRLGENESIPTIDIETLCTKMREFLEIKSYSIDVP